MAMALRAAYLRMHRGGDAHFAQFGVTTDQFLVLFTLADGGPVTQQELATRITSDPNTLRAMVVLLERKGLLVRTAHPTDRRARIVALTPDGEALFETLWDSSDGFRQHVASVLSPEETATLVTLLGRFADSLAEP